MPSDFYISTDPSKLDLELICDYLTNISYWAKGRSKSTIKKSIKNSLCFAVFTKEGKQVGFARVVSDFSVFAWIMDVFVVEEYQGRGLGKLLMGEIMEHEELQGLQRWGLGTRDAHGLYEKYGFRPLSHPEVFMEIVSKPG